MFQDNCTLHVNPYSYTDFNNELLRSSDLDYWLTVVAAGQQEMLAPPRHLILRLGNPGVRVCHAFIFGVFWGVGVGMG